MNYFKFKKLSIVIAIVFTACGKTSNTEELGSRSIESYKKITLNSMNPYKAKGVELSRFPTEEEVLYHNTFIMEFFEAGELDSVFVTPIFRDGELSSSIIGFSTDDGRLLNIVTIPSLVEEENIFLVDVYYIDGVHIGNYEIKEDQVINTEVIGDVEIEQTAADQARSWWRCTKECVKDAHIACYSDEHCMTMLFIANTAGAYTSAAGLGSFSIGIACGTVCLKNRNLDMLPGN